MTFICSIKKPIEKALGEFVFKNCRHLKKLDKIFDFEKEAGLKNRT